MIFTTSDARDETRILTALERLIDSEEIAFFSREGGFMDPNNFPFQNVLNILRSHKFPTAEHFEYGWAIRECGIDQLRRYSPPMRLFAASIYLYCYKVIGFDGNYQGEFFYMLLQGEVEGEGPACAAQLLTFLEWMYEHVPSHEQYSEYDLLLAWSLTAIHLSKTSEPTFARVLLRLRELHYSASDLRLNNDGGFPQPGDWLDLLEKLRVGDALLDAMLPIICGFDE